MAIEDRAMLAATGMEVSIHFDDPPQKSRDWLAALKARGLELAISATELDALRAQGREIRELLAAAPLRRERFVQSGALAAAPMSFAPWPGARVQWRDFDDESLTKTRLAMSAWALAGPGRLAFLRDNPGAAVEAALAGVPPETRQRFLDILGERPEGRTGLNAGTAKADAERQS